MIRVLLVDDEELVRFGLRTVLEAAGDFEVVGEAGDGAAGVAAARELRPDVVLTDIRMPGMDGLTATRLISEDEDLAGVRVLILTTFEIDEYVFRALRYGASGFLGKSAEPEELLGAIRTIDRGDALLSPAATRSLIARFLAQPDRPEPATPQALAVLTDREREVLGLVAAGLTNDEIAKHLVLSPATAKTHVNRAMVKLGARDRAQLVVIAYQSGLVRA